MTASLVCNADKMANAKTDNDCDAQIWLMDLLNYRLLHERLRELYLVNPALVKL